MRYRNRRDANHREIVDTFEAWGASVVDLAAVGKGVSDVLVGHCGIDQLCEIKNPKAKRGQQGQSGLRTADRQTRFRDAWKGRRPTVIESKAQAIALLALMEKRGTL